MARARDYAGMGAVRLLELDSMEKYALVACGDADLYMRLPREGSTYEHKIWDHAAGVALVQKRGRHGYGTSTAARWTSRKAKPCPTPG